MTKNCIQAQESCFPSSRVTMGTAKLCEQRKGCRKGLEALEAEEQEKPSGTAKPMPMLLLCCRVSRVTNACYEEHLPSSGDES